LVTPSPSQSSAFHSLEGSQSWLSRMKLQGPLGSVPSSSSFLKLTPSPSQSTVLKSKGRHAHSKVISHSKLDKSLPWFSEWTGSDALAPKGKIKVKNSKGKVMPRIAIRQNPTKV